MAVLVISGGGRGAGKTAIASALMEAMPEVRWLAVKVTPHPHPGCPEVWEEVDSGSNKDTGRYLRAGAVHAYLIRAGDDEQISLLLGQIRAENATCDGLMVESNHVCAEELSASGEPEVSLTVLDEAFAEAKPSLVKAMERASILAVPSELPLDVLPDMLRCRPTFRLQNGQWMSENLRETVRLSLGLSAQ